MPRKTKSKKRDKCVDCGKWCFVEYHHDPIPACEGGKEVIPLCAKHHLKRHLANDDQARNGQKGGKVTAARGYYKNMPRDKFGRFSKPIDLQPEEE